MRLEVLIDQPRRALRAGRFRPELVAVVGAVCWLSAAGCEARAGDRNLVQPTVLRVTPADVLLRGPDAVQQLAIDGNLTGLAPWDVTRRAKYVSSDPRVVTVDETGLVTACGDGTARITVEVAGISATVQVTVKEFVAGVPVHFANQVVPIFTKLGCNAGGCHGKSSGQNGFRLSLLGFEPALDYETLVKEGRGRRIFPAAPDASLLLTKATAKVPHGGGKRLDPDSHEYRLIWRWIAMGMPVGKPTDPKVERISVYPDERVIERGGSQQVVVTATYSDGTTEDVTRWAQFQSNETDVAAVEQGGRVESRRLAGQAAIMARYQGQVAVFRATVPMSGAAAARFDFPIQNAIDTAALKQWKALGLSPSPLCGDEEFIRRASLDITGTLPLAQEVKSFVTLTDPAKRAKLVDRLLDRPEYAAFFRDQMGGHLAEQARRARRTCSRRHIISTTGSARASRRTCLMTSSCAGFSPPAAARRVRRRCSGIASCARRVRLWTTRRRCSWECGCSAPNATTIRSRNGASTTTTVSRRSSRVWAEKRT